MTRQTPLKLFDALLAIGGCTLVGAAFAGLLGLLIGAVTPDVYYAQFSRAAQRPDFNPIALGLGLGLMQGAIGGAVIGTLVVLAFTWRDTRLAYAEAYKSSLREGVVPSPESRQ